MPSRGSVRLVSVIAALALCLTAVPSAAAASPAERYVVVLRDGVVDPDATATDLSRRHNGRLGFVYEHALKGFSVELPPQAVAALARDGRVAYVERDQKFTVFGETPTGFDRVELDKKLPVESANGTVVDVDVAIIDTGIAAHPDLTVFRKTNCAKGGPFTRKCADGSAPDGNGHGTHVAGTAAARDNGAGVVGGAPGARLWGVKVLGDDGSGWTSWIIAGIDWVTKNATSIEVANMSLGCECFSQAQNDAITRSTQAGVVYVVAAGNNAKDAATFSPANHPSVIAVSAVADFDGKAGGAVGTSTTPAYCRVDQDDTLADFSNFGDTVDLAAPGVCITSTWPGGGYNTISGTSMASPHVAGAAALYVAQNGVARTASRWSTVRSGLQADGWSVPQSGPCGFSGGKSGERFLMLAACDIATAP